MLVILLLLLIERKEARNILWTVLTVVTSLAVTIAVVTAVHGGLTIIHMVALLLVMGLGLDYALFVGRTETGEERRSTRHAVMACALTTSLTFAILADSSIPLLRFLGLTVAVGSAASFVMAFAGSLLGRRALS
jgi:predicted exporter